MVIKIGRNSFVSNVKLTQNELMLNLLNWLLWRTKKIALSQYDVPCAPNEFLQCDCTFSVTEITSID